LISVCGIMKRKGDKMLVKELISELKCFEGERSVVIIVNDGFAEKRIAKVKWDGEACVIEVED